LYVDGSRGGQPGAGRIIRPEEASKMGWSDKFDTIGANKKGMYKASVAIKTDKLGNVTDLLHAPKEVFEKGRYAHVGWEPKESSYGREYHPVEKRSPK
jgi:hypothetical protein